MGFDEKDKDGKQEDASPNLLEHKKGEDEEQEVVPSSGMSRKMSESSICATEEEDDEDGRKIELGPQYTLKELNEKDKDDESLRRWKEQLLGGVDFESVGETLEPDVKILSLAIKSSGRPDIVLPVSNNIVSGLKYTNTVWKTGVKVDSTKEMIGTFSPQPEPYDHEMQEETTPSGIFARGSYSARSKFVDDDNKCYLEINYTFDIRKDWKEEQPA
uniref:Rho GDP-dissociation inhibitor 1-like n=1 Tax=Cucumis melo TaxID=3656 RepID=A0A9I9DPW5_CUCME